MKTNGMKQWVVVAVLSLAGVAMAKPATKLEVTGVVNLNTASAAQLDLLPGIGQKAAKRIIEHRSKTPFAKVEDLRKVKGFGAKKMDKLKPFLTVSGPTTVATRKVEAKDSGSSKATPAASAPPAAAAQGRRGASSKR